MVERVKFFSLLPLFCTFSAAKPNFPIPTSHFSLRNVYLCPMNLPKDFEKYFRERWRDEDVEAMIHGLDAEPQVSIRLNTRRLSTLVDPPSQDPLPAPPSGGEPRYVGKLCGAIASLRQPLPSLMGGGGGGSFSIRGADGHVPWCPEGIYLKQRPAFTADPLLHAGAYYVQEASSMFLAHVLRYLKSGITPNTANFKVALDLCAAPGGKSTLMRSLLPDECLLVSNEPIRTRAQVLAENLAKWGHPNVIVTQAYAAEIAHFIEKNPPIAQPFDLILADVPCSGEGMMRKEEEAVRQWSPSFVAECAALQRSIIADIWPALRPGGVLIYSTCTFNPDEDEQNVEWISHELGADVIDIPIEPTWGIRGDMRLGSVKPLPCYHFLPGQVRGEGFFLTVLQKKQAEPESSDSIDYLSAARSDKKKEKRKGKALKSATFEERLRETLPTLPTTLLDIPSDDSALSDKRSTRPNTTLSKGRTSSQTATMSSELPRAELSLTDAIRYLQREALTLPPDTPRGFVQVCYHGQRLGLMKNLGTRANNLYPKEWRIRSSFVTPDSIIDF